jgi:outer membrane receptor protein involved in Fe transport
MLVKKILIFIFLIINVLNVFAAAIKGKVIDSESKEPLIGATVLLENTKTGTLSNLDGSFEFKNLKVGSYKLTVKYIGYESFEQVVSLNSANSIEVMSFALKSQDLILGEAQVHGSANSENDEFARKSEQKSDNVLNIISAKTIELLPDITVGNLLQRVSGVSVIRNSSGDGQYAVIRGMDKRYNYTLVNGIKIPSPDNKNRYVPMDIFPANLLGRLEVIKALTPSMEGDAIGGAMNMVMKDVPDYLIVAGTVSGGYNQILSSQPFSGYTKTPNFQSPSEANGSNYKASPEDFSIKTLQYRNFKAPINSLMSFSIGNRIFNHKLGFLLGVSYQRAYRGTKSSFFSLNGQPSPDPIPNSPLFETVQNRTYSNQQARLGTNLKLDYHFNNRNKISLFGLFTQLEDWQHRHLLSNQLTKYGDVGNNDRSVYRRQNIINATLQGDHAIGDKFNLKWSAVASEAKSITPDWTDLSVTFRTVQGPDGNAIESARYVDNVSHIWTHNTDRDYTGYVNLTYNFSPKIELATGGMYRDKDRHNYYNDYTLSTVLEGGVRQTFTSIDQVKFSFRPASFAYADSTDANNYSAAEKIGAGYLQAKVNISDLQILGGVRIEHTNQSYMSQLPVTAIGKSGTISYMDILPSVHLKYRLSDKENLRLSYFKGITRPGYFELVPASFPGEYFTESGNYNLKHTVADNIDFRYEMFPTGNEQLLIGAFFKNIVNPIEYGFNLYGNNSYVYVPLNFGTAKNYGAELVFSKYLKNFGVSGNYTYTHSRITTSKKIYGRDTNGSIVNTIGSQTRPLQGQADHIANLSLIYKSSKAGLDAQLSWVYTGKKINIVSPYLGLDYWQRGTSQLDFSAEKSIGKGHFSVFTKLTNLLNNPIIVELLKPNNFQDLPDQTRTDRILVQKDVLQQSYLFGIRYKQK